MPNTRAMQAAKGADNQPNDSDASDREDYDEATEQSPEWAPEAVPTSERVGANARMNPEPVPAPERARGNARMNLEPVPAPERAGANARTDTETLFAGIMESFARMQAETNRSLVETLRSLPYNGGPWQSPLPASTPTPNTTAASSTTGNFAKCTARFNGASREPEVLEAFIDAVQVFKECADVSDDHALRGLPMLLEGDAAVWWRGARTTVTTWKDAVARLRAMYGTQQPAYKILRDVFSKEQKDERAEVFMCKVRSLIVKLPYEVPIPMQIDIIYGLLHRRVRKRLQRDDIVDIDSFVEKARAIEDAISELAVSTTSTYTAKSTASSAGTANVSRPQVSRDRELEKIERTPTTGPSVTTDSKVTFNSNENSKREKRVRCSFCKFYGHSVADCRNLKSKQAVNTVSDPGKSSNSSSNPIRCYGCGQPGVVRSKCEHCLGKSVSPKLCDFNNLINDDVTCAQHVSSSSHPTVSVVVTNRVGVAILDTGANCSVAGSLLYNILVSAGVHFSEAERTIGLADGSRRLKKVLIVTVPVFLEGKQVDTEFVVLPGENTKTLLGRDFIAKAGVTLDLAQESWYFSDVPEQIFPFVRSVLLNNSELMQADISDVSLRDDEGSKLPPHHKDVLNAFLNRRSAQFAAEGPPTDFAIHTIKVLDEQEPLASPPYRLSPLKKEALEKESLKFQGHVILPGGIHMDPGKTSAIMDMPLPQNVKNLKCFLQTSGWFRRFIPGYAEISAPLTSLLKKASTWKWGPEQQAAFDTIKSLLVTAPILRQADATKPFVLRTDSSGYALGAALLQGEGIDERPVEYASRLLTSAERNYNTTEREALAVVWAVSKFRGYIDGAEVMVKSVHPPLRWLMGLKSPSRRLARWALILQEYNLKIEYTPGKANVIADTLSHPFCRTDTDCDLCLTEMDLPSRSPKDVRENQLKDPEVRKITDAIESDDPFRGRAWADKGYVIANGVLYRYGPENEEKRRPEPDCKVGDLVLLQTQGLNDTGKGQTPKFIPRRDGPYRIKEIVGLTTYSLERVSDGVLLGNYHVSLLTPFVGSVQAPLQEKRKRGRPRKANPAAGAQCLG